MSATPELPAIVTLDNGFLCLEIVPSVGAGIANFGARLGSDGVVVPIMRHSDGAILAQKRSSPLASFTLAPFSNRVRDAKFSFAGQNYQLKANNSAGTVLHGDVRDRVWQVTPVDANTLVCVFDGRTVSDLNFPWPFLLRVTYILDGQCFITNIELENVSEQAIPVGFGLHPYFVRQIPGSGEAVLHFGAEGFYATDAGIMPTEAMQPLEPAMDFTKARTLGDQHLDTVFGGWSGQASLRYPGSNWQTRLEADAVFSHFVVFTAPDNSIALEPVSNCTDGFNLMNQGIAGTGVQVLQAGEKLAGTVALWVEEVA
jgi:aldose 1-epimerase